MYRNFVVVIVALLAMGDANAAVMSWAQLHRQKYYIANKYGLDMYKDTSQYSADFVKEQISLCHDISDSVKSCSQNIILPADKWGEDINCTQLDCGMDSDLSSVRHHNIKVRNHACTEYLYHNNPTCGI